MSLDEDHELRERALRILKTNPPGRPRAIRQAPVREDFDFAAARNRAEAQRRQEAEEQSRRRKAEEDEAEKALLFALIEMRKDTET